MSTSDTSNSDQSNSDRWTIKRLLDWTTGYFRDASFDQPRLDAEVLLAEALDCPRIGLYTRFDEEPAEPIKGVFREWVARHAEGEPVAYLVGHKEFFSLKFHVNSNVLIPRPETEHLVTEALDAIKKYDGPEPMRIIDVGTGSGCVAISIAKHADEPAITAGDICDQALSVALQNAIAHQVDQRIHFVQSDLLNDVPGSDTFHLIVSNPPYIGQSEKSSLDRSVIDFEPHKALFADNADGTGVIRRLVDQAVDRLHAKGWLMVELSPMIADRCRELVEATNGLSFERFVNDLAGLNRILIARKNG